MIIRSTALLAAALFSSIIAATPAQALSNRDRVLSTAPSRAAAARRAVPAAACNMCMTISSRQAARSTCSIPPATGRSRSPVAEHRQ